MIVLIDDAEPITLGETETTPTIGIVDYSRRVTDDFGVTTVVQRGFSRRMSVRLALPTEAADGVQRSLAALRASAAQWVADDRFAWLSPMGYYKDFEVDLAVPPLSFCTLSVEGLAETDSVPDVGLDPAPDGAESTFRMLRPLAVTDALLASSTVPEDDEAAWSAGTTYPLGVRVIRASTHRIYESLIAGNIGHSPESSPTYWLDVGPTNRWAMFDEALGTATGAATGPMVVTFSVAGIGALALLDTTCDSVRVEVIHASATVYDQTLAADGGSLKFLDLPVVAGTVRVTIAGAGAISVGTLLIGDIVGLGLTEASPTAGITDFSRKQVDDFGEVTIVQRGWSKRMTAKALIDTEALDIVADRIAAVRARPVLWIGDADIDGLTIFGFFRDFSIEVGETVSKLSLSIEGLSTAVPLAPLVDLSSLNLRIDQVEHDLAIVTSDGYLGQAEKPKAVIDWYAISANLSALNARYESLGSPSTITEFYDDANAKVGSLESYLSGIVPDWDDASQDSPIVAATYRAKWVDAYASVAVFQAAITGTPGANGLSIRELTVFRRAASAPSSPSGGSFNFATKALTPPSGWSQTWPLSGTDPVYAASGFVYVQGITGTATPTWLGVGQAAANGATGADGQATNVIFRTSATQPATPAPSAGVPAGWYDSTDSVPASDDPTWASFGTRPDSTSSYTWQAGKLVEGVNGRALSVVSSTLNFLADYTGALKSGQVPRTNRAILTDGGVDRSADGSVTWSVPSGQQINCSVSIDADGLTTVSAVTATGSYQVQGLFAGFAYKTSVEVVVSADPAPPSTSTGQTTSTITVSATSSYPSTITAGILTVLSDASGNLTYNAGVTYDCPHSGATKNAALQGKPVYRLAGSGAAWTDMATNVTGSAATWNPNGGGPGEPSFGSGTLSMSGTASMPAANTAYEVAFIARNVGSSTATNVAANFRSAQP